MKFHGGGKNEQNPHHVVERFSKDFALYIVMKLYRFTGRYESKGVCWFLLHHITYNKNENIGEFFIQFLLSVSQEKHEYWAVATVLIIGKYLVALIDRLWNWQTKVDSFETFTKVNWYLFSTEWRSNCCRNIFIFTKDLCWLMVVY